MNEEQGLADPFRLPDLWPKATFSTSEWDPNGLALDGLDFRIWQLELSLGEIELSLKPLPDFDYDPLRDTNDQVLTLDTIPNEPLEDLGSLGSSTPSFSDVEADQLESIDEDIWSAPDFLALERLPTKIGTWEAFYDHGSQDHSIRYITEAGPKALDAILTLHNLIQGDSRFLQGTNHILKPEPLFAGLVSLINGRDSLVFHHVNSKSGFQPRFGDVRLSGYSPETFTSFTSTFITFANHLTSLRTLVQDMRNPSRNCRSSVALADYLSKLILMLEYRLHCASQKMHSVLELQDLIRGPDLLLSNLLSFLSWASTTKSDEILLSELYRFALQADYSSWLNLTASEILSHASRPWLSTLSKWIGIEKDNTSQDQLDRPGFVQLAVVTTKDESGRDIVSYDSSFDSSLLPGFLSDREGEVLFGLGQSLRLLRTHQPHHPMAQPRSMARTDMLFLAMHYSWSDIERTEKQARLYEADVLSAIKKFDLGIGATFQGWGNIDQKIPAYPDAPCSLVDNEAAYIARSIAQIEQDLPSLFVEKEEELYFPALIQQSVSNDIVTNDTTVNTPLLPLVPSVSFTPVVSVQARLLNQSTLRLLFNDYKLRSHLSLQHRYQLLGDNVFSSRLSHALFDVNIPSTERKEGQRRLGVSGLKLGTRERWPPASSELRLALMGILSDSYHNNELLGSHKSSDLPGGLSFAIRAMSESELQRCMDPNSIFALDFLRLQYKPPAPLDVIISSASLEKYDSIFRLLLRLIRMMYSVTHFVRDSQITNVASQRFQIEAYHFVSCVCTYLFENVAAAWKDFEKKLDALEARIERYEIGEHDQLKRVRDMHDGMLDDMMFALLLRKRQEMVMGLLEEIFSLVLAFAHRERSNDAMDARDEYNTFRKKVKVFVVVCRGLSERKAFSGVGDAVAGGDEGGAGIGRLLVKLEMSGFYSRPIT